MSNNGLWVCRFRGVFFGFVVFGVVFSGCFTPFLVFFNEKTTVKKTVCNEITAECSEITTLNSEKKEHFNGYFISKCKNLTKIIKKTEASETFYSMT